MESRGAISPAEVDEFVSSARPGDSLIYASGTVFPRFAAGVARARAAGANGYVTFTTRRSAGRVEYVMQRLAKRMQAKVMAGTADRPDDIILLHLSRAAADRLPCPTNEELARKAGLTDGAAASYIVGKLKRAGKIHVEQFGPGKRRVVTIAASGARTRMEVSA